MGKTIKIIILAVIAAVLAVAMIWGIVAGNSYIALQGKHAERQGAAQNAVQTQFEAEMQGVQNIRLDLVCEGIDVVVTNESKIRIEEHSNRQMDEEDMIRCSVNGGTVAVESGLKNEWFSGFSWAKYGDIQVTLYVPSAYKNSLDLYSVSGRVDVQDAQASRARLETISGSINARNSRFSSLDLKSVSGGIVAVGCNADDATANNVSGAILVNESAFKELSGKTISGAYDVDLNDMPGDINISSVSGALTLKLPENSGFSLQTNSVSGGVYNDFAIAHGVYKEGGSRVTLETVSGGISVIKK